MCFYLETPPIDETLLLKLKSTEEKLKLID